MASRIGRRLMWAVVGAVASKVTRRATRKAMHTPGGAPKLPRGVRRQRGLGTGLAWAIGTGAAMAIADVLSEQGKTAARAADPKPER
jgi:hypothetical protein